jgi:hypothetical protein
MHQYISFILSVSVYLFVIGITIWALTAPYMEAKMLGGAKLDVYLRKQCINGQCAEYKDDPKGKIFMKNGKTLMALYIIFLITSAICMMLYLAKKKTLCDVVGLITLGIALATMITLIAKVKNITTDGIINSFEFSTASILIIISCCLMIIQQIMANGFLRSLNNDAFNVIAVVFTSLLR